MTKQHKAQKEDQAQSSTSTIKAKEGGKIPQGGKGERASRKLNKCVWGVSPGEKGSVT